MTLGQLKQALRSGASPSTMGVKVGEGGSRDAYKIGPFVVKAINGLNDKTDYDKDLLKAYNIRFAPTIVVVTDGRPPRWGTKWEIQLYYGPSLADEGDGYWHCVGHDIHANNVARDKRGRYVAFDW